MVDHSTLSRNLERTTVEIKTSHIEAQGHAQTIGSTNSTCTIDDSYKEWLFPLTTMEGSMSRLVQSIQDGTAIGVSDGSYNPDKDLGTAAWRIEAEGAQDFIEGCCRVPGPKNMQSAYRSELVGQLAILQKLDEMCCTHSIMRGHLTLACDGESALDVTRYRNRDNVSPRHKHCDIMSPMVKLKDQISVPITCVHVKGHQDDWLEFDQLDRLAQVNVLMDQEAKDYMEEMDDSASNEYWVDAQYPLAFGNITVDGSQVYDQITKKMYDCIADKKLLKHWKRIGRFEEEDIPNIDWKNQERAIKLAGLTRGRFVSKWVNNYVATGKNMKRWNLCAHDNCPYCMKEEEDVEHILHCLLKEAEKRSNEALWKLLEKLVKIGTCTRAVLAIKQELVVWRRNRELLDITRLSSRLQKVIFAQRKLGWKAFLDGLFTIEWEEYQKDHFNQIGSKKGASLWENTLY